MSINGTVLSIKEFTEYEDKSKGYEFTVLGHSEKITLRAFNSERIPIKGEEVLVSLGTGSLKNHTMALSYGMPY